MMRRKNFSRLSWEDRAAWQESIREKTEELEARYPVGTDVYYMAAVPYQGYIALLGGLCRVTGCSDVYVNISTPRRNFFEARPEDLCLTFEALCTRLKDIMDAEGPPTSQWAGWTRPDLEARDTDDERDRRIEDEVRDCTRR